MTTIRDWITQQATTRPITTMVALGVADAAVWISVGLAIGYWAFG